MTISLPETVSSYGNTSLVVLSTAPADLDAPTTTELAAGEAIQCHVFGEFGATPSQNTGASPRKMCQTTESQELGTTTYTISDIQYSYVPQSLGAGGGAGNEAFEALTPDSEVYLVERLGVDANTSAFTAAEVVNIYHVRCGVQRRGKTGDGEFDKYSVTQSFVLVDGEVPTYDAVVAAGA